MKKHSLLSLLLSSFLVSVVIQVFLMLLFGRYLTQYNKSLVVVSTFLGVTVSDLVSIILFVVLFLGVFFVLKWRALQHSNKVSFYWNRASIFVLILSTYSFVVQVINFNDYGLGILNSLFIGLPLSFVGIVLSFWLIKKTK